MMCLWKKHVEPFHKKQCCVLNFRQTFGGGLGTKIVQYRHGANSMEPWERGVWRNVLRTQTFPRFCCRCSLLVWVYIPGKVRYGSRPSNSWFPVDVPSKTMMGSRKHGLLDGTNMYKLLDKFKSETVWSRLVFSRDSLLMRGCWRSKCCHEYRPASFPTPYPLLVAGADAANAVPKGGGWAVREWICKNK